MCAAPQAMLCPLPEVPVGDALRVARRLRDAGVRLDVQVDRLKLGKQLARAAFACETAANVPFALILGPDELAPADRCRTVRDLRTREQRTSSRSRKSLKR